MVRNLLKIFLGFVSLGILGVIFIFGLLFYFSFDLPKIESLADYKPPIPSQILARDGTILTEIGIEDREIAEMEEIPSIVIDAFLSAADASFYHHQGVDYEGILRAMIINLKSGRVVQGGSTITQQVAKSLLLTRERSYTRKIKDILLAQQIEKKFSKSEILFLYLNQVYFGGGHYGIKNAFKGYFGKELAETTVAESAMMAGLLVAPGKYSPYVNPKYAVKRQRYVLKRMFKNERITQEQYEDALKEKIRFRVRKRERFKAAYFTDWVRQRVIELVGEEKFLRDGLRIVTTLDWGLQQVAEGEVAKGLKEIDKRQGYKGSLGSIQIGEELVNYEIDFRKKILRENSLYFTLKEDFSKNYELGFDDEKFQEYKKHMMDLRDEVKHKRFVPGVYAKDSFIDQIRHGESYKVIVTNIDNQARIIYFSLGGLRGIIPYEQFRWAHERVIDSDRVNYFYVTRPTSIAKVGDIIYVQVLSKKTSLYKHIWKNEQARFKKLKFYKQARKERYILGMLDQEPDAQGALLSVNPHTGEVISFVGGYDFSKSQYNRVIQPQRQPGSAFKPLLYAAALEEGFTPSTIVVDSPEALGGVDASLNWKPKNYDGKFKGPMTFRTALELSRNVPTIKIAEKIGVNKILDFVERICFDVKLDRDLSLALGSFGVNLMEMVSAYAIFPNKGRVVDVKSIISITDRDNNQYILDENVKKNKISEHEKIIEEYELQKVDMNGPEDFVTASAALTAQVVEKENSFLSSLGGEQVYDNKLAYIMSNLLKGVVLHGTGRNARAISRFLGGKTGTTSNYVDAWFMGFSSNLVTGVWTGFDDNKTLGWGETGTKSALPIWMGFMDRGIKKYGEHDFPVPKDIIYVKIDKQTGKLAENARGSFVEAYVEGTEPGNDENIEKQMMIFEKQSGDDSDSEIENTVDRTDLLEDDYFNNQ